tara:strand:- start:347 stop:2563 length:2217 start_codon:yes stop_codon:yes gene_type:complete
MNLFHESKKVLDKDGKVNPLGPYGKQKLTGREVSTYFRRNKVKDPQIKKAVEVALDLQGAMSVASSEIKKFYGDKILKSKEVQSALKYANESVEYDIREDLNEFRRYIVKGPRGEVKVTANSESDAITRARSGHMASTPRSAFSARMEGSFWGQDKMAKKAASHFSKNTHVRLVKDKNGYSRATISKKDKEKIAQLKRDGYKEVPIEALDKEDEKTVKDVIGQLNKAVKAHKGQVKTLTKDLKDSVNENYRKLAQKGMGTETKKDARVGLELDYYDSKGNKHMGKITKKTATGYSVQDDKTRKTHTFKFHDRVEAKKLLAASNEFDKNPLKGFPYNEELQKNIQEEVRSVLGEAPYDKADVKKVKVLEKKLKNMLKEVDKTMRGSGLSAPAFADIRSGISKGLKSIEKFYRVAKQIPMKPTKPGQQPQASISDILKMGDEINEAKMPFKSPTGWSFKEEGKDTIVLTQSKSSHYPRPFTRMTKEDFKLLQKVIGQVKISESINEVKKQEVDAMKKVSKDMQSVLKSYQKIANMGDKELKNTKHNASYKKVLDARDAILTMIGTLNTQMLLKKESYDISDTYRVMNDSQHCELIEDKVLKFTKVKDKSLEKHLKFVTKKVGAKLEKIAGGFQVSDTDMKGFTAVVDYIFDKSIKKNMLDGGGMSDVNMVNEGKYSKYSDLLLKKQRMPDNADKTQINKQISKERQKLNMSMWEDAIEENMERGIMKKMRKGRVAKGMPR